MIVDPDEAIRKYLESINLSAAAKRKAAEVLREAHNEYMDLEQEHADVNIDEAGRVHIRVQPFPREWKVLNDRLSKKLDSVVDPTNRETMRQNESMLRAIFPNPQATTDIHIQSKGKGYHWIIERRDPNGEPGDPVTAAAAGTSLPLALQYYWKLGEKKRSAKPLKDKAPRPTAKADDPV